MKDKIVILGSEGLVGTALVKHFKSKDYDVLSIDRKTDLRFVQRWFLYPEPPKYAIMAAGTVGGIKANKENPVKFFMDNAKMALSAAESLSGFNIKYLYLSSSCAYPKNCPQPMKEEDFFNGTPEPSNLGYAEAKRIGVTLPKLYNENYISAIPASVYGPNDNFDLNNSHFVAAAIRKLITEENPVFWGSGNPIRQFIHCEDLADACEFLLKNYNDKEPINIGSPDYCSISNFVNLIKNILKINKPIHWDTSKPDGAQTKIVSTEKLDKLGWKSKIDLQSGLEKTIKWVEENPWCFERKYF